MNKTILPATFLAALISTAIPAYADTITVDVELTETAKKASETMSLTMTVAEEGSCASATSDSGSIAYELQLCRGRGEAGAPVLSFEMQRVARGKKGSVSRHMKVSSKLAAGVRTVVGRVARGGDATEIAATVR